MMRPVVIGLTGSIGMGKSTVARMFMDMGAAVWDADDAVRRLYARGGAAVPRVASLVPAAVRDGEVDRAILRNRVSSDPPMLKRLEALVHPLVAADRADFVAHALARVVVCDVPLLFETGSEGEFDLVVVVTAPADVQRARVLARGTMTQTQFRAILDRQMPDAEKRARADRVIESVDPDATRAAVAEIMNDVLRQQE